MRFVLVLSLALAFAVSACSPAPRRVLTTEEKVADLYWLFTTFNENYAPMSYKEKLHGFSHVDLKAKYLAAASSTTTNEQFYNLMYSYVAEFKDAHTSASLMAAASPGRTTVAYLGFTGVRKGDALLVTQLLPTIASDSAFPIQVGDKITKLDGVALPEIVRKRESTYRSLGNDEANLTYLMPDLFARSSILFTMPELESALLTVVRSEKEILVTLPWILKDLVTFTAEQAEAAKKKEKEKKSDTPESKQPEDVFTADEWLAMLQIGSLSGGGFSVFMPTLVSRITHAVSGVSFWNSFFFVDNRAGWGSKTLRDTLREGARQLKLDNKLAEEKLEASIDVLKEERNVPSHVMFVPEAKTFPTYVQRKKMYGADGKETGELRMIATMYLDTFSPSGLEADVIKEVKGTLATLQAMGVKDLVIDLINNGGGSLSLGSLLAQSFSKEKIVLSEIQFGLNETWLDDFENGARNAPSDTEKELYRRVFEKLSREHSKGQKLSSRFNIESLMPYQITPNTDLESPMNIVLVVNEMCASMCDIFTGMLKDNGMAKVVGTNTMGAGGNVVLMQDGTPNSHFYIQQTESLILRRDGTYIENVGVAPDVVVAVNEGVDSKYDAALAKAYEQITGVAAKKE